MTSVVSVVYVVPHLPIRSDGQSIQFEYDINDQSPLSPISGRL